MALKNISVVIPTLLSPSLVRTLRLYSAFDCSSLNIQLLIVYPLFLSSAQQDTLKLVSSFSFHSSFEILFLDGGNSIYGAMNIGVRYSKYEWIYFQGESDILCFSSLHSLLFDSSAPPHLILSPIQKDRCLVYPRFSSPKFLSIAIERNNLPHQSIIYSKSIFSSYSMSYDELFPVLSDYNLNLSIRTTLGANINIFYNSFCICFFDGTGISSKFSFTRSLEFLRIKRLFLPRFYFFIACFLELLVFMGKLIRYILFCSFNVLR